ncbi:NRDE family protein, partial [Ralstonia pseudosolanacearum]
EAPLGALPATGVAPEWEKLLSAAFIRSPRYGTRASTVLRIRHDGCFDVTERRFDAQGQIGETRYLGVLDAVTQADTP